MAEGASAHGPRALGAPRFRPRLHETGMKSIRDDLVSGIVLFIIDVYMRPGWKMLRPV